MSIEDDRVAQASFGYDSALMDYETALTRREGTDEAEQRLRAAARALSSAQSARVLSRQSSPVTFATILNDPAQQLDQDGEVMRSVLAYQNATQNTASADPS